MKENANYGQTFKVIIKETITEKILSKYLQKKINLEFVTKKAKYNELQIVQSYKTFTMTGDTCDNNVKQIQIP